MTNTIKSQCVKCNKKNAILKCEGCLENFCYHDFETHREELNIQLDEIERNHDLMQQLLTEEQRHPLIRQINQWEEDSINKIRQTAEETKEIVFNYMDEDINRIKLRLNHLTDRLKQSRQENDFIETNLTEWNKQLIE